MLSYMRMSGKYGCVATLSCDAICCSARLEKSSVLAEQHVILHCHGAMRRKSLHLDVNRALDMNTTAPKSMTHNTHAPMIFKSMT